MLVKISKYFKTFRSLMTLREETFYRLHFKNHILRYFNQTWFILKRENVDFFKSAEALSVPKGYL